MSEEKKTVELKDEELEQVSGGTTEKGNCGATDSCSGKYDECDSKCKGCIFESERQDQLILSKEIFGDIGNR